MRYFTLGTLNEQWALWQRAPKRAMIRCVHSPWQSVVSDLRSRCSPAGVDLVQPFQVAWCAIGDGLPDLGRSSALGVLMGNTRALWPRFLDWLRASPRRLDEDHPLDRYVGEVVLQALQPLAHRWEVSFAQEPPPRRVAMQRLAHLSGLAYLSPSHLNVHLCSGRGSPFALRW